MIRMHRSLAAATLTAALISTPALAQRGMFGNFDRAKPTVGEVAPDFALEDLDGKTHKLHGLAQQQPIILVFGSFT